MNRRWLAVVSGLIVGSSFVGATWGQTASRQPTLAERMAALRHSWTGGAQPATREASTATPTATTQNGVPQVNGRSLLPGNFLSGRTNQPATTRVPAPTNTNSEPRVASRSRAGSADATGTAPQDFTLPGLGGSRLPSAASTSAPQTLTQPQSQANRTFGTPSGNSTAQASQTDQSSVRRSPPPRTALNVNPKDLSRDLAGSFPTEPQPNTPTENTSTDELQPTPADSPLPLSEADDTDNPHTSPPLQVATPANENANQSSTESVRSSANSHRAFDLGPATESQRADITPFVPTSSGKRDPFNNASASTVTDSTVLVTQQTPVITTDIRGPRQILVGREATYRVRLNNQGAVAAEGIVATIRIPNWADVIDTTTSQGTIQQSPNDGTPGFLEWQLVRLDSHTSETLDLRLVPRSSRPLELGVSYTVAPVGSRAVVEVQEPKLEIHVTGPEDVLYGKPQLFRLTITNPGTGTAENVKIDLLPPGGGEAVVSSHPLGDLAAGTSKTVEVELTPREAGKLSVKAHAVAEGGLAADADKEIFCRKPELQVDWRGPEQKYAGTQATYFFRVRNPGTAPAENVTVRVALPEGAEYAGASEGQSLDAKRREVSWNVGALGPGDDYYMELKCLMQSPGANQLNITAAASGDLTDIKTAQTNVVALADLKLDVSDPTGPVAVGEEAVYEIRVKNRGACSAHEVNIVVLFSEGIEPDQVEGALYTVTDGRVTFRTIDELPAGRQIALRIRAKATQPGTHVFRAEVLCKDQEIKLAAEETTRFYTDDLPTEHAADEQHQSAERYQQAEPSAVR